MQTGSSKQRLLLVDGDPKSLRVLDVSLKKLGYLVTPAATGVEALAVLEAGPPDLVISDTHLPELDGFQLCRRIKERPEWAKIPFIFLSSRKSMEDKIRGLELGVEDYLSKPVYIKEIVTRVKMLLQRRERERLESKRGDGRTKFAGKLSDIGVVDLVQTIEVNRKSGIIHVQNRDRKRGALYFRDGKIVDAEVGRLQSSEAVYRMFFWADGNFEVEFKPIRRRDVIDLSAQALLMEGMRRVDEWTRVVETLPPLDAVFVVDYHLLADRLADIPDEVNGILRLFDGRRTLGQVVEDSDFPEIAAATVIGKLLGDRLVYEVHRDSGRAFADNLDQDEIEASPLDRWLGQPAQDPIDLLTPDEGPDALTPIPEPRGQSALPGATSPTIAIPQGPAPSVVAPRMPTLRGVGPEHEALLAAVADARRPLESRGTRLMSIPQALDADGSAASNAAAPVEASDARSSRAAPALVQHASVEEIGQDTSHGHTDDPAHDEPALPVAVPMPTRSSPAVSVSTSIPSGTDFLKEDPTFVTEYLAHRAKKRMTIGVAAGATLVVALVFVLRGGSAPPDAPSPMKEVAAEEKAPPAEPVPAPAVTAPVVAAPPTAPSVEVPVATVPAAPAVAVPAPAAPSPAIPAVVAPPEPPASPAVDEAAVLVVACRQAHDGQVYKSIIDECGKALKAKPDAADVMAMLANAELDKGNAKKALTWAKKASEADPNFPEAYVFIGSAEQVLGRPVEAKNAYLRYLELAPTGKYAADLKSVLAGL